MKKVRFIEIPPFNSFVIENASRTFGLKDFFKRADYELEIVVAQEENAKFAQNILEQEKNRSSLDAILQGVGGSSASVGLGAAALAGCPLCYPVYAAFAPLAAIGASILILPVIYSSVKRIGQQKIMRSLDNPKIIVEDYSSLSDIIEKYNLSENIALAENKDKAAKLKVHSALKELQETARSPALSNAYGRIGKKFGKTKSKYSLIIKPVKYKPVSKKKLAFAGAGLALLIGGGALYATGTNPLDLFKSNKVLVEPVTEHHKDILEITGMTCDSCAQNIEEIFENSQFVKDAKINYSDGSGVIWYDSAKLSHEDILNMLPKPYSGVIIEHEKRR